MYQHKYFFRSVRAIKVSFEYNTYYNKSEQIEKTGMKAQHFLPQQSNVVITNCK